MYLQVAKLHESEKHRVLDRVQGIVHVEAGPGIPENGLGPDVQSDLVQFLLITAPDVVEQIQGLLEIDVISLPVLVPNVKLREKYLKILSPFFRSFIFMILLQ